jgi:UDP-GlcNAc:undecaprenyl-phosphate GlcNAc-1-phosphate transferase
MRYICAWGTKPGWLSAKHLAMNFPFNSYIFAVASAFAVTFPACFAWKKWCLEKRLVDDPGKRKIHSEPIPLAGGLAIITGLLVPIVFASLILLLYHRPVEISPGAEAPLAGANAAGLLQHGFSRRAFQLIGIFIGAIGMVLVGLWDDVRELSPRTKFLGQVIIATLVALSGTRITLFVHNPLFHYLITVFWILTFINAFNFMDNMNGLCAGLSAIGALYFGLIAAADGQYLVALLAFLTLGALLGFLPHNFPRARVFLGDAGSHLLGYLMAILAILPHFYTRTHPRQWAVLIPLFVLAIPLLDLVWVVILRTRMGQPFYIGDTNHLSHRLVRMGLSPTAAVMMIWLASAAVGGLAFLVM